MDLSDFMRDFLSEIHKSLLTLDTLLKSRGISYVVIGGMAVIHHKYIRTTDDIDILVDHGDMSKLDGVPKDKLTVVYSGTISGDGVNGLVFPSPSEIAEVKDGIPYISLENLIELKLSSGIHGKRLQDFGDVQNLIKANQLARDYCDGLRTDLKEKYGEIWDWAPH